MAVFRNKSAVLDDWPGSSFLVNTYRIGHSSVSERQSKGTSISLSATIRFLWSTTMASNDIGKRFLQLGALLFLLGLISGLITGAMANPRMGLSAHLEGVMNGTFLLAVGAIWSQVVLSSRLQKTTFYAFAFGTTVNWMVVQLAALWGTGRMTPIAAPGREAAAWQEAIVSAGLISLTIAMLIGSGLLLFGVVRRSS